MHPMIASLPMYDWPETGPHLDKFWHKLRPTLKQLCESTPTDLNRTDLHSQWQSDDVLLSQTCAYPLTTMLPKSTVVMGTPMYQCDYCEDGLYASPILVRQSDKRQSLTEFAGATLAFNNTESQSGFNALKSLMVSEALITPAEPTFFNHSVTTGSHRNSIKALANGTADICAIDPVCWAMAQKYDADASQLRVLTNTAFSPALPLICSANAIPKQLDEQQWRDAVMRAFEQAIDANAKEHLLLKGVCFIPKSRYLELEISKLDMVTQS